jgi:hypothetical protein
MEYPILYNTYVRIVTLFFETRMEVHTAQTLPK